MFSELIFRLRSLILRSKVEAELGDEIRFHFDQQVEKRPSLRPFARGGNAVRAKGVFQLLDCDALMMDSTPQSNPKHPVLCLISEERSFRRLMDWASVG
jgi:hypothetical protein